MADDFVNSKGRFSSRVDAYVKYRPGYPAGMYELFRGELGRTSASVVADVGSGTGISAEPLLRKGNTVYCVEPNADMRAAAERLLSQYAGFRSVEGAGEHTSLADRSVDAVISAQAFHWLDHPAAAAKFRRILRPGGFVAIIWNKRRTTTSPFLAGYDELLVRYSTDYSKVGHEKFPMKLADFEHLFALPFRLATFANAQHFDLAGLRGRVVSSSYTPSAGQPGYTELYAGLDELYSRFATDGRVVFEYETEVFIGRT